MGTLKQNAWLNTASTLAHETVVHLAIRVLQATLVTGYEASVCTPWAEANQKDAVSNLIKTL